MKVTASAISLNVADVAASAQFLTRHLGFREEMSADGFTSLTRDDVGFNVIFLRTGLETFHPKSMQHHDADGALVVFVVEDVDSQYVRLRDEGAPILTPIETEPWGERYFQLSDPNGIVVQLVQWVTPPEVDTLPPDIA